MDNIKFETYIGTGRRRKNILNNICTDVVSSVSGKVYRFKKIQGIQFSLNALADKLIVKGSIHKFLKGDNYSEFNLSDIKESLVKLCDILKITENTKINILSLEYAINIKVKNSPIDYCDRFISYKGNEFQNVQPKIRSTKKWGKVCFNSTFTIKLYDKKTQTLLSTSDTILKNNLKRSLADDILRYEIRFIRPKELPNSPLQVKDLYKAEFIETMNDIMLEKFDNCVTSPYFDPKIVLPSELKSVFAWQNTEYRTLLKKYKIETYKKEFKKYTDICSKYSSSIDPLHELRGKIQYKLLYRLLN